MDYIFSFWKPILEILIIWWVLYALFRLIQGTRAVQVMMGVILFALMFYLVRFIGLETINWVMEKLLAIGVIALLIIFQPELRRVLARMGQNTLLRTFFQEGGIMDEVVKACEVMSKKKIGALIAIEREVGLKNYVESGVLIDAKVSSELILSIFFPKSPLHDGGIIIVEDKIASCGSLFPLTQNVNISKTLGTRHRAAIGLTEETDAVSIVVSEETGGISVSVYGKLTRDLDAEGLRRVLKSLFKSNEKERFSFLGLWRGIKNEGEPANKQPGA
ncbi:MAG: TIGR00159 family protein [Candidatus Omnitrophica bacterium]|nr:TIGR00159 family protein [Candidatus Omnitrophota bacterium]